MAQEFPKLRCAAFIIALAGLFLLYNFTYSEYLWEKSRGVIIDMQAQSDADSLYVNMLKKFSDATEDEPYLLFCLFIWPFVCRERFWYYIIAIQFSSFIKINLKMLESEPRPTWVWGADIASYGCASSFGSPSGHSTRSANLAFLLILDQFFPSDWSRAKYAELQQMAPRSHPLTFFSLSLFTITFWLFSLYNRVFLGKHGINQIVLGSQLGIWCAFFSHYILRDCIFAHFTRLTHKASAPLTSARQTLRYIGFGSIIVLTSVAITCIVGFVMISSGKIKQEWLMNMRDICGEEFSVDESTGLLVPNKNGLYNGTISEYSNVCALLGLYIGQVIFRLIGLRLGFEAYTTKGFWYKLIAAVTLCCLQLLPIWLAHQSDLALWAKAIYLIALPNMFMGLIMTYALPKLTNKVLDYPTTMQEQSLSQDDEAGKSVQINGKSLLGKTKITFHSSSSPNAGVTDVDSYYCAA